MSRERFLRCLAWLPVALPLLICPVANRDGTIGSFALKLCFGLYALPIYALIAAIFLGRLRGASARAYWTVAAFAPVILLVAWYAIGIVSSLLVWIVVGERPEPSSSPGMDFIGTVLALGYFYVGLAWVLYWIADHIGWLRKPAQPAAAADRGGV
jgi:hypothetical protein